VEQRQCSTSRKRCGGASAALRPRPRLRKKSAKKPRKAARHQNEVLMPIAGKKTAAETATTKLEAGPQRKPAWHADPEYFNEYAGQEKVVRFYKNSSAE
jgi:hypothetical protein